MSKPELPKKNIDYSREKPKLERAKAITECTSIDMLLDFVSNSERGWSATNTRGQQNVLSNNEMVRFIKKCWDSKKDEETMYFLKYGTVKLPLDIAYVLRNLKHYKAKVGSEAKILRTNEYIKNVRNEELEKIETESPSAKLESLKNKINAVTDIEALKDIFRNYKPGEYVPEGLNPEEYNEVVKDIELTWEQLHDPDIEPNDVYDMVETNPDLGIKAKIYSLMDDETSKKRDEEADRIRKEGEAESARASKAIEDEIKRETAEVFVKPQAYKYTKNEDDYSVTITTNRGTTFEARGASYTDARTNAENLINEINTRNKEEIERRHRTP